MPLPMRVTPLSDFCEISDRWQISQELAQRLIKLSTLLEFGFSIISGYRTPDHQDALREAGRPAAPNDVSTHLSCPATGADVRLDVAPVQSVKLRFGTEATRAGLRWGGGSPVNPDTGIPSDWNHVDLGPRRA